MRRFWSAVALILCCLWSSAQGLQYPPIASQPIAVPQTEECRQWVEAEMSRLSLAEQVGQLFVYTIAPEKNKRNLELLREAVETHHVGGLLFSGGQMAVQAELTNRAQQMARVPLLITFDGEWGLAMRLSGTPSFPRNMVLGCIGNDSLLHAYGREVARQCREIGVQVNFAPVADVNINPKNPVINTRSFGEQPARVAEQVAAYVTGLQSGGVLAVCKHFPGHGDTDVDSHKALPLLPFTRQRLDSIELPPFRRAIAAGVGGVMVGHLQVPALEPAKGLPASLSRRVVSDLLVDELGFGGLVFTDALAMKGVAAHAHVSLQALKAGNDLVLAPRNLKAEIGAVLAAIERGELSRAEVAAKCRKVLMYKYALGLKEKPHVRISGLENRVNTPQTQELMRRLNVAAVTLLRNQEGLLPFAADGEEQIALLEVGPAEAETALARQLDRRATVRRFVLRPHLTAAESARLADSLSACKRIVVAVHTQQLAAYGTFFTGFAPSRPISLLFFTPAKTLLQIEPTVVRAAAVVLAHSAQPAVQHHVADLLFGKAVADGRLSASIGSLFPAGVGERLGPATPRHFAPEEYGLSAVRLARIDTIVQEGIGQGAFPGCQVVVMRHGQVVWERAYGTQTGPGSRPVSATDIYDVASLSKTTGTLLALMRLYDKGHFNLTDRLADYLPFLRGTDKEELTVQEVLYHQSGLPSWLPLYQEVIDTASYRGRLFSTRRDAHHPVRVGRSTWGNPHFSFRSEYLSATGGEGYVQRFSRQWWVHSSFRTLMQQKIAEAPLRRKSYVYSDVGFLLLGMLAEQLAGLPLNEYLHREFYAPMGLHRTGYLPWQRHDQADMVPSTDDRFLRKEVLRGFVHDEAAALLGGVAGHAGLFSTARELAALHQLWLDGGEWRGRRYLSRETCRLFTTARSGISRRGLGFDRPDVQDPTKGSCAEGVPAEVYGHTGFTGTSAWADPVHGLVYVFLSNRIYPDVVNTKINDLRIRERVQEAVYRALL